MLLLWFNLTCALSDHVPESNSVRSSPHAGQTSSEFLLTQYIGQRKN
jgi:hypothetical protein